MRGIDLFYDVGGSSILRQRLKALDSGWMSGERRPRMLGQAVHALFFIRRLDKSSQQLKRSSLVFSVGFFFLLLSS